MRIIRWPALFCAGLVTVACGASEAPPAPAEAAPEPAAERAVDAERAPSPPALARDARPAIVFLGTSLTAGLGVSPERAYPARIQERLDAAGLDFRVVNAGVSGDTSAGGLRRLDWLLRQPVDVLVVELGANDMLRGQDPDALRANLQEVIDRTRERHPDAAIVLAGMQSAPNLGDAYARAFERVYAELASENGLAHIPFLLDGVAGVPDLNQADAMHPNEEGHARIADGVWRVLEPILRERQEARASSSPSPASGERS